MSGGPAYRQPAGTPGTDKSPDLGGSLSLRERARVARAVGAVLEVRGEGLGQLIGVLDEASGLVADVDAVLAREAKSRRRLRVAFALNLLALAEAALALALVLGVRG